MGAHLMPYHMQTSNYKYLKVLVIHQDITCWWDPVPPARDSHATSQNHKPKAVFCSFLTRTECLQEVIKCQHAI